MPISLRCLSAGFGFIASRQDVIFVNGGLQPKIRIAPGVPQLWRIVNAAWKVRMLERTGCRESSSWQWPLAYSSMSQDFFWTRPCSEAHLQSVGWTWIGHLPAQEDALQRPLKRLCSIRPRTVATFMQEAKPRLHMPMHMVLVQHEMERGHSLVPVQGYADLVIITEGPRANARAPCTMSLLAKDGVYLMQIPRQVDDLVLAAGNRCEIHPSHINRRPKGLAAVMEWQVAVSRALPRQLHHEALWLESASQRRNLDHFDAGLRYWCSAMAMWGTAITSPLATSVLLAQGVPVCRHSCIPCAVLYAFTGASPG